MLFALNTKQFDLPKDLLQSLCYVESNHKVLALHKRDGRTDSYGICQVKYETAVSMGFKGSDEQLMAPATNIYYAAKYLKWNIRRYNGNITKAVIAYNRGNAKGLQGTVYSQKVLKQWRFAYERH